MTKIAPLSTSLAAMLVALLPAAPAQALNNKSFVSSTGSGTACTQAAPCNNFADAQDATTPGGEINCLDSGLILGANISKSITIDCAGTAATTNALFINGAGGAGIVVRIRNLSINGLFGDTSGIEFAGGATLIVENCVVQNFNSGVAIGIRVLPAAAGSQLVVTDTSISNNGTSSSGGGIVVNPQFGGDALVMLERVTVADNAFGIVADGSGSTAGIAMVVANSTVHRNRKDGIVATTPSGGAPIGLMLKNTRSVSNNIGIRSTGPGVTVRADNATVMHNGTGLVFNTGAALLSFGNNNVEANGVNGAFSGPVTLK